MHDRFKKKFQAPKGANLRLRRQIAVEAAKRMFEAIGPAEGDGPSGLRDAPESAYYAAKRKAAAVLGHIVRPGDLPSDAEVRAEVLSLARARDGQGEDDDPGDTGSDPEPDAEAGPARMADHIDRFALYALRLAPLEAVKQDARHHPEGDALYHSLQVFEVARLARPYDEEFLVAALLHDVGKAIDPRDHVASGVEAVRGAVTPRSLWLIEHHMDLLDRPGRPGGFKGPVPAGTPEWLDDLRQLRDADDSGRVPGATVCTVAEALDYLRGLEAEDYLDPGPGPA